MAHLPPYLIAYNVLTFASALVFALTTFTVLCSKRLQRGKGWFGMMACWFIYSLSYGILVGKQTGPQPSFAQCFVQSIFVYAAPPFAAVATLCFYLDFYLGSCWDPSRRRTLRPVVAYMILLLPWIVHLAIDIEIIILTLQSGASPAVEKVESNLYCHLHDHNVPSRVNAVIVVLSMILLIPLEVWTGIQLYQCRNIREGEEFQQYLAVYLRIAACTGVAVSAFGLSMLTLASPAANSLIQDMSFPCVSMAISLIFASQQDLVNVWLCRVPRRTSSLFTHSLEQILPKGSKTSRDQANPSPTLDVRCI